MTFEQVKTIIIDTLKIDDKENFEKEFANLMLTNHDYPTKEKKFYELINRYKK